LQQKLRQKSTHIKIATKTETKIDRHKICNKNSDKSTHMKIAVTEKNKYTKNLQQKLRENEKHIKIAKTATKSHTHTHTKSLDSDWTEKRTKERKSSGKSNSRTILNIHMQ